MLARSNAPSEFNGSIRRIFEAAYKGANHLLGPQDFRIGLRLSQGGTRSWIVAYRYLGPMRWLKVGTYPLFGLADARQLARNKLADVQKGLDPATVKQTERQADSFKALAERYLAEHARVKKKPRSAREDEKNINRELLPLWGHDKANKISRRNVIALVDSIGKRAPIQANRVLALISKSSILR